MRRALQAFKDWRTVRAARKQQSDHAEDPELEALRIRHELTSQRRHIIEVIVVTVAFIIVAFVSHEFFEWALETAQAPLHDLPLRERLSPDAQAIIAAVETHKNEAAARLALARELLSGLTAILITFVGVITYRLRFLASSQATVLTYSLELVKRFAAIQARDNIIVPSGMNYRVLSVADLQKLPDPIDEVWRRVFGPGEHASPDADPTARLHGCAMLFWDSIDDVINSPDYIRYFSATGKMNFFRVLVTPKPRHDGGLRVYMELARHFASAVYVIDQDRWNLELCPYFRKSPHLNEKRKVLGLLDSQIEIISDRPILGFDPDGQQRWLVRYLHSRPGDIARDQRWKLAQPASGIITYSSTDERNVELYEQLRGVAAFMNAVATCGYYRDATEDGDIEALFATALPDKVKKAIERIGEPGAA